MVWLGTWANRLELTIDSERINEDLTNFPVLITLASGVGRTSFDASAVFDEITTNNKKIAVTTVISGVEQQLYVEIDEWDYQNEVAYLWTKITTVYSGTDTIFYLYYDSSQGDNDLWVEETATAVSKNVWNTGFEGVYHLQEDPSVGNVYDSTSYGRHGTPTGSMVSGTLTNATIGKGIQGDGDDDEISMGTSFRDTQNFTIEAIFAAGTDNDYQALVTNYKHTGALKGWHIRRTSETTLYVAEKLSGSDYRRWKYESLTAGPHHISVVYGTSGVVTLYVDGYEVGLVLDSSSGSPGISFDGTITFQTIGGWVWSSGKAHYKGRVDEIRYSNIIRSDAWIKATYYSNWDSLITYGPGTVFYYEGYVTVNSSPAARTVSLYKRDTSQLVDTTVSRSADGWFQLGSPYNDYHFVVALPDLTDNYAILTDDKVHPSGG